MYNTSVYNRARMMGSTAFPSGFGGKTSGAIPPGKISGPGGVDIGVDGSTAQVFDFDKTSGLIRSGDWNEAVGQAKAWNPAGSEEESVNMFVIPSMIAGLGQRNYEPLRQRQLNPYRRQAAMAANEFFRGYKGMQGAPALSAYIQNQAPYLKAQDAVESSIANKENADEEKALQAMMQQYQFLLNDRRRWEEAAKEREASKPNPWMQGLGILGTTAGAILGGPAGAAILGGATNAAANQFA